MWRRSSCTTNGNSLAAKQLALAVIFVAVAGISGVASAAGHLNKNVRTVHSPDDRPCLFFQLEGVSEADPVHPGNSWFAVPISHNGYNVIAAMLLTSFTTDRQINVTTTGGLTCGHAEVRYVYFAS